MGKKIMFKTASYSGHGCWIRANTETRWLGPSRWEFLSTSGLSGESSRNFSSSRRENLHLLICHRLQIFRGMCEGRSDDICFKWRGTVGKLVQKQFSCTCAKRDQSTSADSTERIRGFYMYIKSTHICI